MGVTQNITALIDYYGMTQRTFAKRIGKTQSAVSQWLVGGKAPSYSTLKRICEEFNLTEEDLLSETNGLYARYHGLTEATPGQIKPRPSYVAAISKDGKMIGCPSSFASKHKSASFIRCEDDGMDKIIPEGCDILVDPDAVLDAGSIIVADVDGKHIVRRYYKGSQITVLSPESHNQDYEDEIFEDVSIMGRVVWFQAAGEL